MAPAQRRRYLVFGGNQGVTQFLDGDTATHLQVSRWQTKLPEHVHDGEVGALRLFSLEYADLPISAISEAIAGDYEANAGQFIHVRQGRTINRPHLVKLIEVGVPDFPIPDDLRPAAPVRLGVLCHSTSNMRWSS